MTEEITAPDRVKLGLTGLVLACAVVAVSAYAGPLLEWVGGTIGSIF